jgi:hypothetical protein
VPPQFHIPMSGKILRRKFCPLSGNSGQRRSLARDGLPACDAKRTYGEVPPCRRHSFLRLLFILGAAAFGLSGKTALAASANRADAVKRAECEREATLRLYIGKQRSRWIRQCVASSGRSPGKPMALRPSVTTMPRVTPLGGGNPPSTSTGSTAPSNAPVAPSTPVVGSRGTSTSGSSATSTSGSSNNSIGGSGR